MKFDIKSRFSGSVLFSLETESLKLCVEAAVKSGAYLYGADLRGADLRGAYLYGADLRSADLYGADLRGAYLYGADLHDADLRGADLRGAGLYGANLHGASLGKNKLVGERPFFSILNIGSRNETLIAFLTDKGVYVRAGCFFDTLDAFKAAVLTTHGPVGAHAEEYGAAVTLIELHAKLWTPVETAKGVPHE